MACYLCSDTMHLSPYLIPGQKLPYLALFKNSFCLPDVSPSISFGFKPKVISVLFDRWCVHTICKIFSLKWPAWSSKFCSLYSFSDWMENREERIFKDLKTSISLLRRYQLLSHLGLWKCLYNSYNHIGLLFRGKMHCYWHLMLFIIVTNTTYFD